MSGGFKQYHGYMLHYLISQLSDLCRVVFVRNPQALEPDDHLKSQSCGHVAGEGGGAHKLRIVFHWTFSCAVGEELELCGAMSTLSMERSGESAGSGSNSNTSSAQPASFPSCAGKKLSGAAVRCRVVRRC